ncbi:MAG: YbaB/EbfC family nucleoid-associated protein [Acidobacteria bacterium]|nr:YbaB/EbfC family nucleoid-associated protein [Acidobacteriota bacterium]MCY3966583.1 YbaB/EbfC family nucleoid-associated protein [Acidobacteriota bacterium]
MNIQKLMRQAQEMQQQMQRDLAAAEFTASVGGGMVEVRMNGEKEVLGVHIDPEVLDPEDAGMVQDLVQAAVNEAGRKVNEYVGQRLGGMAAGIPGLT